MSPSNSQCYFPWVRDIFPARCAVCDKSYRCTPLRSPLVQIVQNTTVDISLSWPGLQSYLVVVCGLRNLFALLILSFGKEMPNMNPETAALLSTIPALPPPPGEESNFTNGETLGNVVIIVNSVFLVLMLIAITIRLYTKAFIIRSLWWDDCKIIQQLNGVLF